MYIHTYICVCICISLCIYTASIHYAVMKRASLRSSVCRSQPPTRYTTTTAIKFCDRLPYTQAATVTTSAFLRSYLDDPRSDERTQSGLFLIVACRTPLVLHVCVCVCVCVFTCNTVLSPRQNRSRSFQIYSVYALDSLRRRPVGNL